MRLVSSWCQSLSTPVRPLILQVLVILSTVTTCLMESSSTTSSSSFVSDSSTSRRITRRNAPPDFNITLTQEILRGAREEIIDSIDTWWRENRTNLSAKFLRLSFHDAVGGPDGCVDMSNPDNFGLDIPIMALQPIVHKYESLEAKVSRADLWALSGLIGSEVSQKYEVLPFPMQFVGRINCEDDEISVGACAKNYYDDGRVVVVANNVECRYDTGPHRSLPSPDLDTEDLLDFFADEFEFDDRETVVIMGAHTIGGAAREHSGFHAPKGWVRDQRVLDNEYYKMIVGEGKKEYDLVEMSPNWSRERFDNSNLQYSVPAPVARTGIVMLGEGNSNSTDAETVTVTIPDRFVWTRRSDDNNFDSEILIMTTSDIALVREVSGHIDPDTKDVGCSFLFGEPVCPFQRKTGFLMAEYRNDNRKWVRDFRDTLGKMIRTTYDYRYEDYETECTAPQDRCLIRVDESVSLRPTPAPITTAPPTTTAAPSRPPTTASPTTPSPTTRFPTLHPAKESAAERTLYLKLLLPSGILTLVSSCLLLL